MLHDHLCELKRVHQKCTTCAAWMPAPHCHCASRVAPYCDGCRTGQHLKHQERAADVDKPCICDLCADESEAA